jgi:hypothetical protein
MWTHENRAKYNRDHLRYPSDLTDDEWALVERFIPPAKPHGDEQSVSPGAYEIKTAVSRVGSWPATHLSARAAIKICSSYRRGRGGARDRHIVH